MTDPHLKQLLRGIASGPKLEGFGIQPENFVHVGRHPFHPLKDFGAG
jgi:hypothetical protein